MNKFTTLLKEKPYVLGPFMKSNDPALVEIAGLAGFDFVILDMEHGPLYFDKLQNLIRAAEVRDVIPVIRIPENNENYISSALDIGAQAVQVPKIINRRSAEAVVSSAKFHPEGSRGVCRYVRSAGYSSKDKFSYYDQSNKEGSVIIHLEGKEALENFDEIITVEGIDVFFLGPYDLSQSIGYPGEVNHPEVENLMREIVEKASRSEKFIGTFVETPEIAQKWIDLGVKYISFSVDVGIYLNACIEIVKKVKGNINTLKYGD